jgi:hypothetical protein
MPRHDFGALYKFIPTLGMKYSLDYQRLVKGKRY